jgi:hypothetical protein
MPRSRLIFSTSSSIVVHVVSDADSRDPGVMAGVSPTDSDGDFFAFFSKNRFDRALTELAAGGRSKSHYLNFWEYSRSIMARSR